MIVVDASVLANLVADDDVAGDHARERMEGVAQIAAPDLVDVEVVSVLRRRWLAGDLATDRFEEGVTDLLALPVARYPVGPLMRRAFELRANVTAYDACYVGLAEALSCPLLTADARLAAAPTIRCPVEVVGVS